MRFGTNNKITSCYSKALAHNKFLIITVLVKKIVTLNHSLSTRKIIECEKLINFLSELGL